MTIVLGRPRMVDYEKVKEEIQKGSLATEIASKLQISSALVYKIAKFYGIQVAHPQKRSKYPEEEIVKRAQEIGNGYRVDQEFGLPEGTTNKICKRMGVSYGAQIGRPANPNRTKEEMLQNPLWRKIWELHQVERNQHDIARKLGVSSVSVNYALHQFGVFDGKGRNHPREIFVPDTVSEMYSQGLGCREIGEILGISDEVVRKKLSRMNVTRRVGKAEGSKNPQWKGGRSSTVHYYRRQSYEVCAICLGKPLPRGHVIHHIDENPKNNHPSNLMIFESQSLHARFHQKVLKNQWIVDSEEAIHLALEIGGTYLPQPSSPIELLHDTD